MPLPDPHLVLTLSNAGSSAVGEAARLLQGRGFALVQEPRFGPDSGSATLQKESIEVQLDWFLEAGLAVRCRNQAFEKERDGIVELLRPLKHSR